MRDRRWEDGKGSIEAANDQLDESLSLNSGKNLGIKCFALNI